MTIYVVLRRISNINSAISLGSTYLIVYEGPVTAYSRVSLLTTSTASASTQMRAPSQVVSLIGLGSSRNIIAHVNPPGSIVSLIGLGSSHRVTSRGYPSNAVVSLIGLDSIATVPATLLSSIDMGSLSLVTIPYVIDVEVITTSESRTVTTRNFSITIEVGDQQVYGATPLIESIEIIPYILTRIGLRLSDYAQAVDILSIPQVTLTESVQQVNTISLQVSISDNASAG